MNSNLRSRFADWRMSERQQHLKPTMDFFYQPIQAFCLNRQSDIVTRGEVDCGFVIVINIYCDLDRQTQLSGNAPTGIPKMPICAHYFPIIDRTQQSAIGPYQTKYNAEEFK